MYVQSLCTPCSVAVTVNDLFSQLMVTPTYKHMYTIGK